MKAAVLLFALVALSAGAQTRRHEVHVVYMGGNDCPPCVAWRRSELPLLQEMEVWKTVKFSYVSKSVRTPVPPVDALPEEVRPLKAKLDVASGGNIGSPQIAFVVDGEVFDYFFGGPTALEMETRILAAQSGKGYGKRCVERGPKWSCTKPLT